LAYLDDDCEANPAWLVVEASAGRSWRTPLCSRKCVDRFKAAAKVTTSGWAGSYRFRPSSRKPREGVMTLQISQRGNEYLKTAQTLLRTARTMTDQAFATQLKALADDYERRAEKASLDDAKHYSIRCSR
jgi:hypothetical protein